MMDFSRRRDTCVLCGVGVPFRFEVAGEVPIRVTFWNRMQRVDYEETTQGGWLTVSGRDIFISSH